MVYDANGIWVSALCLSDEDIAACRDVESCWFVNNKGLAWARLHPDEALNRLAIAAYQAYGRITDMKNYQGNPMPEYADLPDPIKAAWRAAVSQVYISTLLS